MYLRIDEIGENYEVMKAMLTGWITNTVEQERGPVPMDTGAAELYDDEGCWDVDAV